MKRFTAAKLCKSFTSIFRSWSYIHESFADDFQILEYSENLRKDGPFPVIWQTKQKFVLKGTARSGRTFAYKAYNKLKSPAKFFFRLSPCGLEAMNFQRISDCGIALPRLLAVGDIRKNFILKTAFIITEFAEGYSDGRDFTSLKDFAVKDKALLDEFIMRNMALLAKLHDHNILHRGFTPANLLYQIRQTPDTDGNNLDLMWIDVASCRKSPRFVLKNSLLVDFEQFFRFFDFTDDELLKYLQHYCKNAKHQMKTPDELLAGLKIKLAKRAAR